MTILYTQTHTASSDLRLFKTQEQVFAVINVPRFGGMFKRQVTMKRGELSEIQFIGQLGLVYVTPATVCGQTKDMTISIVQNI